MGNYTTIYMFENPKRGRQARNFTKKYSENSRSQIVFRSNIFRKLTLCAPVFHQSLHDEKPGRCREVILAVGDPL